MADKLPHYRKIRGDALLNRLKPEQQDEVIAYCESTTLEAGVAWLKAQFNIGISTCALSRWLKKQKLDVAAAIRLKEIRAARQYATLIGKAVGSTSELTEANSVLIAQAVFEELLKPEEKRDQARVAKYMNVALKAKDQQMRDKSLSLAESRFRFDASKSALREAARLHEINQGPEDEREKIEKVMLLLFGPKPIGFSVPPGKENA
jgi:hypothetical protein